MKKLIVLKCTALFASILTASAASAAMVGQWSNDMFIIRSNVYGSTPGALYNTVGFCIKADHTYYVTAQAYGSIAGTGKWIQNGNKVFMHGNSGRTNEYMWAHELNRVDSTHLAGNSNLWTLPTNSDFRDQYFSNQFKYVGATCLPPAPNSY